MQRRHQLREELNAIYTAARVTTYPAYVAAQKALKQSSDLTFSDDEIDVMLPQSLRKNEKIVWSSGHIVGQAQLALAASLGAHFPEGFVFLRQRQHMMQPIDLAVQSVHLLVVQSAVTPPQHRLSRRPASPTPATE